MTALLVRDLLEADLPWMATVEREIFGNAAWSEALIHEDWRYGHGRYRGVEVAGKLVAYAVYGFDGDAFHLMNLAVTEAFRGQGIARKLVDEFVTEGRRLGAPDLWLEVAVDNTAALALYASYGFEQVRVRRKYYQPGDIDGLVMRLELRAYEPEADAGADPGA